ncbi:uncharacterized protein BO97DRAFT_425511 [Aspergillus homomorphus CBS 101889]|uniref:F-box domain-containing protein n=1 Tax=Aspergillus homomorphus (strain CBS 101889) TaxID=1450537 RepID=A0A395HZ28_ASPHC|nr:hypothetical protein BO97DRAFT_425511 [Aspergillus homomorphus CBS 101889]RAL11514.1 hypothetical protein BO97DRAFT_425511 [Aspergillus homomorphus CBS 101889]
MTDSDELNLTSSETNLSTVVPITEPVEYPRVFGINELLEEILMQLDTRTLLLASRVHPFWFNLIKNSKKILRALFFLPHEKAIVGQPGIKNPLLVKKIWDEFLARRLHTRQRPKNEDASVPIIASREREEAYSRPEASWRLMLLQQPPTSIFRIFVSRSSRDRMRLDYTHGVWKFDDSNDDADDERDHHVRLGDLEALLDQGCLATGSSPLLFWTTCNTDKWDYESPRESRVEVRKYLALYDFVVHASWGHSRDVQPRWNFWNWLDRNKIGVRCARDISNHASIQLKYEAQREETEDVHRELARLFPSCVVASE